MRHGILLFSLLVLLAGASGGVFVLVHQERDTEEIIAQEVLVAGVEQVAEPEPPVPTPTSEPEQPKGPININTAGYEALQGITGVGAVIAQRIIDYRSENGLFQKIEDLKNVKGIGDVNFGKMKDEITI